MPIRWNLSIGQKKIEMIVHLLMGKIMKTGHIQQKYLSKKMAFMKYMPIQLQKPYIQCQRSQLRLVSERFFILTIFAGFLLVLFFQAHSADAHSALLEMEPAEDVVAEEPPSTLELRFNEPIDPDLAMVTIYDWNAKPVFTGNPDGDSELAPLLTFSLPDLKEGTYTVKWNIVSADGHPVDGSYAFSV